MLETDLKTPLSKDLEGSVLAIGNFDGVHRGHQAVLAQASALAAGRPVIVLSFEPHPRSFFKPGQPVFRITPAPLKKTLLEKLGVDGLATLDFNAGLASLLAEDFVQTILIDRLKAAHIIAGHDFHFGKARTGTPDFLKQEGAKRGVNVTLIAPQLDEQGGVISSSRVREALQGGAIDFANDLLGYRWLTQNEVVSGDKRGRALGFPTANMRLPPDCQLKHGVYAVRVHANGAWYMGAAHYGLRVQFGGGEPLLEVHVLDFSGDLYGRPLRTEFCGFVRPEQAFADVNALVEQMHRDVAQTREIVAATLRKPRGALQAKLEEA